MVIVTPSPFVLPKRVALNARTPCRLDDCEAVDALASFPICLSSAALARRIGADSVLNPQSLKQIVLNCTSAIDETEGAIMCLTTPERFVLLFWQAFKEMVRW
jgi:hypothetical protein